MKLAPAPATPRKAMTPARRARIVARDGEVCARLDCDCTTGLQVDHVIPLDLTGKDEDENLQLLCTPHHAAKTRLTDHIPCLSALRAMSAEGFDDLRRRLEAVAFERTRAAGFLRLETIRGPGLEHVSAPLNRALGSLKLEGSK